eukprot:3880563-Rhodomonas_salina.3
MASSKLTRAWSSRCDTDSVRRQPFAHTPLALRAQVGLRSSLNSASDPDPPLVPQIRAPSSRSLCIGPDMVWSQSQGN